MEAALPYLYAANNNKPMAGSHAQIGAMCEIGLFGFTVLHPGERLREYKNASTQLDAEIDKLTAQDKTSVPQEVQNAVLDNRLDARTGPRRFDVAVNNMAAHLFNALAADAGVNIVTDPDVAGTVSLQLRQVTLDEVLDVSRDMFGYEYQKQGGIYTVYARQMRTQVFQINNIDVARRGQTDTQVNIGSTASSASNNASSNSSANSSGGESAGKESASSENNSGARVQTKHESHFGLICKIRWMPLWVQKKGAPL